MRNQHYNCLQFITIPPVMEYARGAEERNVVLKSGKMMRKESLVKKT